MSTTARARTRARAGAAHSRQPDARRVRVRRRKVARACAFPLLFRVSLGLAPSSSHRYRRLRPRAHHPVADAAPTVVVALSSSQPHPYSNTETPRWLSGHTADCFCSLSCLGNRFLPLRVTLLSADALAASGWARRPSAPRTPSRGRRTRGPAAAVSAATVLLLLEDALHDGGRVADGHGHRALVLVALGGVDADAGVRDACGKKRTTGTKCAGELGFFAMPCDRRGTGRRARRRRGRRDSAPSTPTVPGRSRARATLARDAVEPFAHAPECLKECKLVRLFFSRRRSGTPRFVAQVGAANEDVLRLDQGPGQVGEQSTWFHHRAGRAVRKGTRGRGEGGSRCWRCASEEKPHFAGRPVARRGLNTCCATVFRHTHPKTYTLSPSPIISPSHIAMTPSRCFLLFALPSPPAAHVASSKLQSGYSGLAGIISRPAASPSVLMSPMR